MATRVAEFAVEVSIAEVREQTNGVAVAAFLAAGIGAFAVGLIVLLNEMGLIAVPALYQPAGGVSGRTTLAIVVWLGSWAILHFRWKEREVNARRILTAALVLTALGILGTFPPVWSIL